MTSIVKLQAKGQFTIPSRFCDAAGLVRGALIEATLERGRIVLTPKKLVDLEDTLTPSEARKVRRGEAQIKRGQSESWNAIKHALGR